MKKILTSSIFVTALLLVAGCGGSSTSSSDSTAAVNSETMTSEAPDSPGISMEEAGQRYVEIVTPTNCALTRYSETENSYSIGNAQIDLSGIDELTGLVGEVASARQQAVEDLVRGEWPETVKSDIEQMAIFWAGVQRAEVTVSQSTDTGTWNDSIAQWKSKVASSDSGLSKIIRIKLSLPEFSPSECS
ncbi:MAG: hypothetical protein F2612_02345 [Actinobacteria bacterium]|uniref:Unannotated protein n=1 Tax=freshwater metagenome TaxID=449393 RepID=A0A6J6JAJ2_9ZZZZ|nr:hypothetical protein [Actinomycetota bacterium]MSZ31757.1 hypothetical protein [Actinomycetota bacterium]